MFCPKCGSHSADSAAICENCGLKFGSATRESVYAPVSNTYRPLPIVSPSIYGKSMGIAAMITGIISIVFCRASFIFLNHA